MCEQLFYVFSTDIVEGQLQKGTEENETWKRKEIKWGIYLYFSCMASCDWIWQH